MCTGGVGTRDLALGLRRDSELDGMDSKKGQSPNKGAYVPVTLRTEVVYAATGESHMDSVGRLGWMWGCR